MLRMTWFSVMTEKGLPASDIYDICLKFHGFSEYDWGEHNNESLQKI